MLNYFIHTTNAILMASVIAGVIAGYTRLTGRKVHKTIMICGAAAGLIVSIVIAVLRNNTKLINTASMNSVIYTSSLAAFLLFVIFLIPAVKKNKYLLKRTSLVTNVITKQKIKLMTI